MEITQQQWSIVQERLADLEVANEQAEANQAVLEKALAEKESELRQLLTALRKDHESERNNVKKAIRARQEVLTINDNNVLIDGPPTRDRLTIRNGDVALVGGRYRRLTYSPP